MASLYLDHNISLHLIPPLRLAGHNAVAARDLGAARFTDDVQLLRAFDLSSTLVTHNRRDFVLLHDAWISWSKSLRVELSPHYGILVLDFAMEQDLANVAIGLLRKMADGALRNELLRWHRSDGWLRRLPGAGWARYSP